MIRPCAWLSGPAWPRSERRDTAYGPKAATCWMAAFLSHAPSQPLVPQLWRPVVKRAVSMLPLCAEDDAEDDDLAEGIAIHLDAVAARRLHAQVGGEV